jgi:hypothetical protein
MQEPITEAGFSEWKTHPVTKRLMKLLMREREEMKEGLINNSYENEEDVKGRCRAIGLLMDISYEELANE